jgi:DNA-binding response OmpR family regulator
MNIEFINRIAPEHDRTTCNDENLFNVSLSAVDARGCRRCDLLCASSKRKHFILDENENLNLFRHLSKTEYATYKALLKKPGAYLTIKEIEKLFESIGRSAKEANIRSSICHLRLKLEKLTKLQQTIKCVRGRGYAFTRGQLNHGQN